MENWKDINGFEGLYQISDHGRVKSLHRGWQRIVKQHLLGTRPNNKYMTVYLQMPSKKRTIHKVHRLVGLHFIDNPDHKPIVNHNDGDKTNNHILNLSWATYSENGLHAYKLGLNYRPKGELSPRAKLSTSQVRMLRELHKKGCRKATLTRIYKISPRHIKTIIDKQVFKEVS